VNARINNPVRHTTMDQALVDEFEALLASEGVRDVSHWTLPNDDVPFNEDDALVEFGLCLDSAFEASSTAIDSIGAAKK